MSDIHTLDIVRGVLRFFRRQPLVQLAIAASFWAPLTIALRLIGTWFDFEATIETAVAPWAFQATAAGLAYLCASMVVTLSNQLKATGRRKARAKLREEAKNKKQIEREARFDKIQTALNALDDNDRALLRLFVDHKTKILPLKALESHTDAIHTLEGFGLGVAR